MGPNDVEVVRVFTRAVKSTTIDRSLPIGSDFEVVVEAEAGQTAIDGGLKYEVGLTLKDIDAGDNIPVTPPTTPPAKGTLDEWTTPGEQFVFTVKAADLKNRGRHAIQAYAFLLGNARNFDSSQVTSELALLLP